MNIILTRYAEFVAGKSAKFYRVTVTEGVASGNVVTTVTWGKIGTTGQSQEKYTGDDKSVGIAEGEKIFATKIAKGYAVVPDRA